eukprot:5098015-Prymnesium_polylepis.1
MGPWRSCRLATHAAPRSSWVGPAQAWRPCTMGLAVKSCMCERGSVRQRGDWDRETVTEARATEQDECDGTLWPMAYGGSP